MNYRSLKSVQKRLSELDKKHFLFKPFDNGMKLDIFKKYENKSKIILDKLFKADDNWKNYKYVKKNFINDEFGLITYLNMHFPYKNQSIKKQVIDFINLLSTDSEDAYLIANIFSYIYEAKDFKSKEYPWEVATEEEKIKLLDFPLKVLKANKSNEAFRLGALYNMMHPDLCEEFLFNESHVLVDLFNTSAFQHNKRNQPELDRLFKEHLKNKNR